MPVKFGIDIIIASAPNWKTKRIGLLTNDAAKTNTGVLSINSAGVVTTVAPGTANITYTYSMYGCTFVQTKSITVTGIVSYRNTLDFDGTNDYLTVPDNNALDLTTNYTLEAWVKADGFNWLGGIISKYNSNGSNGYVLRSNQVSPYTGLGFDGQETANGVLQLGVWHHIAAVKEGNSRKLYVDGTEVALTSGYSHTVSANSDPVIIGKDFLYETNSRYWNGKIDEIRIWNIAKTQAQVQALKDNELVGNESGLVLYYNFNQGTAGGNNSSILSVLDGTSAARNASIVNFDKSGSNSNFIANDNGPVIVGPSAVCVGLTATYTNRTTGGTWGTSNSSIFTVSTSGVLTAIAAGTADLTYTFTSNNCTFTVSNSITISPTPTLTNAQALTVGDSPLALTGSGTPASSNAWVSSNTAAATISSLGVVTPVGNGTTTITYTNASGCSATASINVKNCAMPFGNALSFGNGSISSNADYVEVNSRILPTTVANFTIETWVKPSASDLDSNFHGFIGSNGRNPSLYIYEGGKIHASYVENTGTGFITPNVLVNQDKWSHLALVKNGTTITLYVNGLQAYSQVCAANFTLNDNYYWLGKIDNQFNGALDEVRFWSTARTQAEIQAAMNTELVGTETGLLTYFDFNQGIGGGNNGTINTVTNKANNALNGSLNGFTKTATASNFVGSNIANLDISGAATICSNSSSQYSHPIAGGTWSISTSGANATISASGLVTSTVNENITLSYTYTLNGCSFTVTKAIAVNSPAAPVAITPVNVCQGTTAAGLTATALALHTLQWYTVATTGTATTTPPTPSRSVSGSTLYYVSQKNNASTCEGPRTAITVVVNAPTAITTQPVSPSAVCLNASSNTISVTATGQNVTYQWYTNTTNSTTGATAITNATTNSYVIPTNVAGTKYYYVVVTGTCGSAITSTIVAQVINSSTFTTDVSSTAQNIAYGGTATALTVGSPGATAYQWYSTPTKPSLLSGFSGTAGFTSSLGAFQAYSFGAGQYPAINDGVLTFAYRDNTSVSRDFDLDQTATTISFSTEYAETDIGNNRAGDTGKIQLQFLNASNVAVGTTVESALLTGTLTYQTVSLANVSIPTGATKARVIFLQVNETEGWAGNYGIAFRNPSVTTNVALNGTAINGATATSYTPLTTTPGALYYYAVASGGCSTASSSLSGLITVAKANPTIASMAAISKTFGDAAFTLTAPTSNSTGAFTFTSSNAAVATISGTTVTVVGAGTATITATQATDANYNAGSVTTTLTVAKGNPTIAAMADLSKTVGDAAFTLTSPTSNSTGAFTYTSSNTAVATISGSMLTVVGAGTATITATQASSTNYNAGSVTATITVAKRNPTIASMATISKTFGDAAFTLTAPTSNSTGAFTYTSSDTDVVTISGSTVTIVGVGTATITATQASSTNYNTGSVTTTITVAKANPTLGSMAAIAKTYGDTAFTLTAPTSNSTGAFTYTSGNNAVATIAGSTVTIVSAGTATITIAQAADINYNAGSVTVSLTVAKAARTLTNFPNLNKTTTDVPFTLVAPTTNTGTGAITYSSSNLAVATINGATVTIVGIGTSVITATQAADANYEATSINATLTVIIGDSDGDGVSDAQEAIDGTNPNASDSFKDTDNDGVADSVETENDTDPNDSASFIDTDNDGVPNYVEARQGTSPTTPGDAIDSDRDGVPDYVEVQQGTNPIVPGAKDTDGDGVADYIEVQQGTSPTTPGNVVIDTDADGVPDYIEVQQGTSQTNPSDAIDSDGDGVPNYVEVQQGTNPTTPGARDTDGDGVPDFIEKQQGTNPTNPGARDTDGDGVADGTEKTNGTSGTNPCSFILANQTLAPSAAWNAGDCDGDGLTNSREKTLGLNPLLADTDGDGLSDGIEVSLGSNPLITDTDGDGIADNRDNCPLTPNANQADNDQDGKGDICDNDDDNDGVLDTVDNCPISSNSDQADRDRDGKGDVCDTVEINVSQAITPNGDGVNDTWVIYNLSNHPGSIVRVFNRWGKEVFYSADYQNNWTGHYKDNSEKLPTSGSYFYQIDLGGDGSIDAQGWLYITQ